MTTVQFTYMMGVLWLICGGVLWTITGFEVVGFVVLLIGMIHLTIVLVLVLWTAIQSFWNEFIGKT